MRSQLTTGPGRCEVSRVAEAMECFGSRGQSMCEMRLFDEYSTQGKADEEAEEERGRKGGAGERLEIM